MNERKMRQMGAVVAALAILAFLSLINIKIFDIYDSAAVYIVLAAVLVGLFTIEYSLFDIVILIVTLVYLVISVAINGGGIGSVLTYFCGMSLLVIISRIELPKRSTEVLRCIASGAVIALFALSLLYINNYWVLYSSSRFVNPNTYCVFLMFGYMLYCCLPCSRRNRIADIVMTVITVVGVYNYRSRAMLAAVIAFILLILIENKKLSAKKLMLIAGVLTVFGIVFPFVYLALYKNGVNMTILGKSLYTGREKLWVNMLKAFSESPLNVIFGLGSNVDLGKDILNVHNNLFVVIVNFGLAGFVLYLSVLMKYIGKACRRSAAGNREAYRWLSMFFASILLLGCSETMSFWPVDIVLANIGLGMASNAVSNTENNGGSEELPA